MEGAARLWDHQKIVFWSPLTEIPPWFFWTAFPFPQNLWNLKRTGLPGPQYLLRKWAYFLHIKERISGSTCGITLDAALPPKDNHFFNVFSSCFSIKIIQSGSNQIVCAMSNQIMFALQSSFTSSKIKSGYSPLLNEIALCFEIPLLTLWQYSL